MRYSPKPTLTNCEGVPEIAVSGGVVSFISEAASQSRLTETGGILIGHRVGNNIQVTRATDSGPNAEKSRCRFVRDTVHCQAILDTEFAATGADYVGEWHSHLDDLRRPSLGDMKTLAGIILDPDYGFPSFAMMLALVTAYTTTVVSFVVTAETSDGRRGRRAVHICEVVPSLID